MPWIFLLMELKAIENYSISFCHLIQDCDIQLLPWFVSLKNKINIITVFPIGFLLHPCNDFYFIM